jgi:exonuclease SbcD
MLRILHLADIHLGMENYGRTDPATGLSSRLGDFLRTLDEALDWALSNDVHLVLLAGDVYKNRDPSPTVQREFARRIQRLSAAGVPMFILVGNHDLPNAWARAHTVEIFDTLQVPHTWVARQPRFATLPTTAGPVQIIALPWVTPATLLTKDEFRTASFEQLNGLMIDKLEELLDGFVEQLNPALPTILTAHAAVQGAVFGAERSVMLGHDLVLPRSFVARPEFDYVAMGHIHRHQVLPPGGPTEPPIIYPGSLERIDFGEEDEEKGFMVVDIGDPDPATGRRRVTPRFHPVGARRFLTLRVSTNGANPTDTVLDKLRAHEADIAGSIVRVIIKTTPEQEAALRDDEIRKALEGAAYIVGISRDVDRPNRVRFGDHAVEQMTPRQALELYMQVKNVPATRAATLLSAAEQLMNET